MSVTGSPPTAPARSSPRASLVPPDATAPAASACDRATQQIVTITVDPDVPQPRCVSVSAQQELRVVNRSNAVGQRGSTITVRWADFSARTVPVGATTLYTQPFGAYLEGGVHDLHVSLYGSSSAQVWLR
jgi:hypothetical protein